MNLDDLTPEQRAYHDRLRSVGTNVRKPGKNWEAVREYRSETSGIVRKTLDEGGNVVTQHSRTDRQDVHINAKTVTTAAGS
jgi:hypothetical protein